MDLVLLSANWQEKSILLGNDIDLVVEPESEDAEISIKTDLNNAEQIELGNFAAIEGTDFGGRITKSKIDYGGDTIEFSGPSWWQYFTTVYVKSTAINNISVSEACRRVFANSQFEYYEIVSEPGAEAIISTETLGVKYSLADCLKIIEKVSGKVIKFRYENNTLKVIVGTSKVYDGINAVNTNLQISVDSFIPDFFVLVGDKTKPQQEGQSPIGTLSDGTEFYPQTILSFNCETGQIVQSIDDEKIIKIVDCGANNQAEMQTEAVEKYADILAGCYGVSGDISEQFPDAEVGDSLFFIDERYGIEFERKFTRKILQATAEDTNITFELGDISYV